MKMSFFCIHGSVLLLSIILLFIKQRKQVIAVKCLFYKILKRKYSQKKIFSNENSETAIFCISLRIQWYFSQISVIKIEIITGETDINPDKKVIQRWFFAISWKECMVNYPIYDNFNMSPTHCENFRQLAQIYHLWCGYEYIEVKFI